MNNEANSPFIQWEALRGPKKDYLGSFKLEIFNAASFTNKNVFLIE
jgi:hypothetical protein